MIDGIIFDKDGTLFDFRASWSGWARHLLRDLGRDEAHARAMGVAIGFDVESGTFASDSLVIAATVSDIAACLLPYLSGLTHANVMQEINVRAATAVMLPVVPLRSLLALLKMRGLRVGLATNDAKAPAGAHLAAHDITEFFDFVAGSDSGYGAKPGPGMCLAFAAKFGLDPARVVMVGDSLHDLEAGRAAGMRTVAVLTGIAGEAELAPYADVVLADIGSLPAWLDQVWVP